MIDSNLGRLRDPTFLAPAWTKSPRYACPVIESHMGGASVHARGARRRTALDEEPAKETVEGLVEASDLDASGLRHVRPSAT